MNKHCSSLINRRSRYRTPLQKMTEASKARRAAIVGEEIFRFDTDPSYLVETLRQLEAVLRSFPAKQAQ